MARPVVLIEGESTAEAAGRTSLSSVRWSALSTFGQQGGRLVFSLLLARLIGPVDFGVVAQANIYLALVGLLLDQGLGAALIQRPRLEPAEVGSVAWLSLATTSLLVVVTLVVAPLAAGFFHTDALEVVLLVLAADIALKGIGVVPTALLMRELQFRILGLIDIAALALGGVAGAFAAFAGAGYWSFVVMVLLSDAVATVGTALACGRIPFEFSFSRLRSMVAFSRNVLGFQSLNYLNRNLDNIVVGRWLGPAALANYALSYRTMLVPVQNIGWLANRVSLPVYARNRHGKEGVREQFLTATRLVALISFPLMAVVVGTAPAFVPGIFGQAWVAAIMPMQVLALTGARQSIHTLVGPVFLALNQPDWQFRYQLFSTPVYAASFFIGVQWGIVGVAVAYTVAGALLFPGEIYLALRLLGCPMSVYFVGVAAPALAAVSAGAVSWGVVRADVIGHDLTVAIAGIGSGIAVYAIVLRLISPSSSQEFLGIARRLAQPSAT